MAAARRGEDEPLYTPDGRYLVVRGRLWRRSNPALPETTRQAFVAELMRLRAAIGRARRAGAREAEQQARAALHEVKVALGERGAVWWDDGAPDLTRRLAANTPYGEWYRSVAGRTAGGGRRR